MPRGGRRVGAGRKPKLVMVGGALQRAATTPTAAAQPMRPPTTNIPSPIEEFDAPDSLTADERRVWMGQAPHAFRMRTLTRTTAFAFERYCRLVVREVGEAQGSGLNGPNHRGLLREIRAYEQQFMLTPCGKPMPEAVPEPQQDDDDQFFGGPIGLVGGGRDS
jgi:hypothetical protein